jgi:hypothetical protein
MRYATCKEAHMTGNPFQLRRAVGPDQTNSPFDVLTVKDGLARLGAYSLGRTGLSHEPTEALFDAIRFHQDGRQLKVDGIINPGGETAQDIGKLLQPVGSRSAVSRCVAAGCGTPHGNLYGLGYCSDCIHKMFPGMSPSEILDILSGPKTLLPKPDK